MKKGMVLRGVEKAASNTAAAKGGAAMKKHLTRQTTSSILPKPQNKPGASGQK